jgi:xylan 1,4-beta-xylosidase
VERAGRPGIRGCIDPGHVVGEDGKRYLFVNGIRKIRLRDDGLATDGELQDAYQPWRYPEHWITENFAPEGPKLLWRDGWLYLVTAVGGTAGPATGPHGHRRAFAFGAWPVGTLPAQPAGAHAIADEPWWSRGHATLVEGPAGDWWMVYHGYENGFRTLGRQALLEPVEWTDDGWFRATGGDLSKPLRKPAGGKAGALASRCRAGFSAERFGVQWCFHQPGPDEERRIARDGDALILRRIGHIARRTARRWSAWSATAPTKSRWRWNSMATTSRPACCCTTTRRPSSAWASPPTPSRPTSTPRNCRGRACRSRERNGARAHDQQRACRHLRAFARRWPHLDLHGTRMEVSGMHHNVFGGFLSLRVGLFAIGKGAVRLRDFRAIGHEGSAIS